MSPPRPDPAPPRVVLFEGGKTWRILKPRYSWGSDVAYHAGVDRRVEEECVVHGGIDDAHRVLHKLEQADAEKARQRVQIDGSGTQS